MIEENNNIPSQDVADSERSGDRRLSTCSLLARLEVILDEIKKLEDVARGPGKHEAFMGLRRASVSVAHSIHHEKIREANELSPSVDATEKANDPMPNMPQRQH